MDQDALKQAAGRAAAALVTSGMVLGLGTGSTAYWATLEIGEKLRTGQLSDVVGVATSLETERLARKLEIRLVTPDDVTEIDLTIDGADQVDGDLNVVKGGGGALLREKIVASITKREVIVVDDSKVVDVLGLGFPLPVEVVPFGWQSCVRKLQRLGFQPDLRIRSGSRYLTAEGNYILDCSSAGIADPEKTEMDLNNIPGVVENGLFIGMVDAVFVASEQGVQVYSSGDRRAGAGTRWGCNG